jgi:hypothetical protein
VNLEPEALIHLRLSNVRQNIVVAAAESNPVNGQNGKYHGSRPYSRFVFARTWPRDRPHECQTT